MFEFIKNLFPSPKSTFQSIFPNRKQYNQRVDDITKQLSEKEKLFAQTIAPEIYTYYGIYSDAKLSEHIINKYRYPPAMKKNISELIQLFAAQLIMPRISCSINDYNKNKNSNSRIVELSRMYDKQHKNNPHTLFPDINLEYATKIISDPDVYGIKICPSSAHDAYDICDLYYNTDFWGLGPGIYPKNNLPEYPIHKNCMCLLQAVYCWDIEKKLGHIKFNKNSADDYLMSIPASSRKEILGEEGFTQWKKGRSCIDCIWESYGHLTKSYKKQYGHTEMSENIYPLISRLKDISLGARYHFLDVLIYTTYSNPYRRIEDMTHYATRQLGIDIIQTSKEIMNSGLIEIIRDPKIILSSYTKVELMEMMTNPPKIPKKSWTKKKIIEFMIDNYAEKTNNLVSNSTFVKLAESFDSTKGEAIEYLKEAANIQ